VFIPDKNHSRHAKPENNSQFRQKMPEKDCPALHPKPTFPALRGLAERRFARHAGQAVARGRALVRQARNSNQGVRPKAQGREAT
jgi:hypothetical protein